jgi:ADP-ribose pyrophosphatase
MAFELLKSEIIHLGRVFTLRSDTLRLPDGRETRLDVVEHAGSVIILPMDANGNLLFVRQYRHAVGLELLEFPAGTLNEGESPDVCARRELQEETGMSAKGFLFLGGFYLAPGYSTEYMHAYLATELYFDPLEPDADEFLSVESIPLAKALAMAEHGELPDAKSLAVIHLGREHLKKL